MSAAGICLIVFLPLSPNASNIVIPAESRQDVRRLSPSRGRGSGTKRAMVSSATQRSTAADTSTPAYPASSDVGIPTTLSDGSALAAWHQQRQLVAYTAGEPCQSLIERGGIALSLQNQQA